MATQHPTVLLVDDEKANLRLLSDLLREDANIVLAQSGGQAVEKAVKLLPDLILLDIMMPDMDGFDTLRTLRSIPMTQSIPVIFITGLDNPEKEQQGLRLGAQDYIHKPFNAEVVRARIATQLEIVSQRQQLQQLSVDLTHASEAKSRFLANMSHEIRTPLTSIIGYAEAIQAGEIGADEHDQAMQAISTSGKHLLTLLNDILDLSKVEAGKLVIELQAVNLHELLEEVEALVRGPAQQKGLDFRVSIQAQTPERFLADPLRLKQILVNLIGNSIKFTHQGSVSLEVSAEGSHLSFAIRDTGIGIEQDQLDKLFAPFEQGHESIGRQYGGTGLGLSISQQLAARMDGHIEVSSKVGKGSCFTLVTALYPATAESEEPEQPAPMAAKSSFRGKVLLAEDSADSRHLLSKILQSRGLEVKAVENGQQMLEAAMGEEFDLILSDINMPVMDGLQAIKLLRAVGVHSPVIALTANVLEQDVRKYLQAGFTDHLAKPVNRQRFNQVLATYLKQDSSGEELSLPNEELRKLKDRFIGGLPDHLAALQTAFRKNNRHELEMLAHKLRGTAALFQFKQLSDTAARIEKNLQSRSLPETLQELTHQIESLVTSSHGQ
ncbi:response regulator [Bowmanella dokdonensis]|uniref:histidine kinase n=1 Tax=Bowmanella dokdonensis TaxID=751969 RepID=A0A939IMJ6_9ALTE|nr:response regulator [Bowmanella dokdonensis]MBN7825373.1 response regulator [Bowmanella dokdonensis]